MDTINGWKEILRVFGAKRTLLYLMDGSLEKRIKEYAWEKNEKPIIDLLVAATLDSGVIKAIDFLNGGLVGETFFLMKDDAKFLSKYFVKEEGAKESIANIYKKVQSSISAIGPSLQFELYRKASRKLLKLIGAHSNHPDTVRWLWALSLHISQRYEDMDIKSSDKIEQLKSHPGFLGEMKYIDSKLGRFLRSQRFDTSLREEIIQIQSKIGLQDPGYFAKLLIWSDGRREIEAAAEGYISAISREKWAAQNYIRAIRFLLMQASQQKGINVKTGLIRLIDALIRRHTEDYRAISVKLLPALEGYMITLGKEASKNDVVPEIAITSIGKMFDYSNAMKILAGIIMVSCDAHKKELAFNEAVIIAAERLQVKGMFNIKLAKKGMATATLRSFGLYTPYKYAVQQMAKSIADGSELVKGQFIGFFSICPPVSLAELKANIKKLNALFKKLDAKYKAQRAEIEANFKLILDGKIGLDDKVSIIEGMKGKQYCGKEWSELRWKIEQLSKLEEAVKEKVH